VLTGGVEARDDGCHHRAVALSGAFSLEEARECGLTRAQLLGKRWRRIGPGIYAPREAIDDLPVRLRAAWLRLPGAAVFSGPTAAHLHGLDPQWSVIEATLPPASRISRRAGMTIRRCRLEAEEIVRRKGFRVTSPLRTVVDIASRSDLVEAVVILDAALHKRLIRIEQIEPRPGDRGVRTLRRAIELAEPATESPMETRLRMVLVLSGLPRPEVQVRLRAPTGFLARADLYYSEPRLVVEYDGATHRDSIAADNRRQNRLVEAGYRVLRFTAADVFGQASAVVATVRQALCA
jgi:very-short-patch-repair endonuclease